MPEVCGEGGGDLAPSTYNYMMPVKVKVRKLIQPISEQELLYMIIFWLIGCLLWTDARRPVPWLWIHSAEVQGERERGKENENTTTIGCLDYELMRRNTVVFNSHFIVPPLSFKKSPICKHVAERLEYYPLVHTRYLYLFSQFFSCILLYIRNNQFSSTKLQRNEDSKWLF